MADRFWVGGTANWDSTAGTKWATTSGGAGGAAIPTSADDVFFDASSGVGVCTLLAGYNAPCRSLDFNGYTGTFTIGSTTASVTIGTTTPGPGNIALRMAAGMTLNGALTGGNCFFFASTSATQQTLTFAGKTMPSLTFNAAGNWLFSDTLTSGASISHTAGTLNFGNQTVTCGIFAGSGSTARTLTLGSSAITITSGGSSTWQFATVTNLTMTANTATVSMPSGATFTHGGNTNGISLTFTGTAATLAGAMTLANFTKNGAVSKTDTLQFNSNVTITGALTVNGNSVTNRLLLRSDTIGTARTVTAATVSMSNVDLRDITGAGAGSWNLSAITGNSGDCGGNTGITLTSPTTQTATGTASFTWSTHGWTSRVPLPQDTAVISNAFIAGRTVTMDMPRTGTIDFTGSTGNVAFTSSAYENYGHLTLRSGMGTITMATTTFLGTSQQNFTTAGNTIGSGGSDISASRSVVQLQDAFSGAGANIVSANSGTWDTQSFSVSCRCFILNNTTNNNVLGTSVITVVNTSGVIFGLPGVRAGASNADFIFAPGTVPSASWGLGGAVIKSLTWTNAIKGSIILTGGGTIGTLTMGASRILSITSGTTLTIGTTFVSQGTVVANTGLVLPGTSGNYASAPDSSVLDITGDITLVGKVTPADWTPASNQVLIAKWGAGTTFSYELVLLAAGTLRFDWSTDGSAINSATSTVATGFTDGTAQWVAVTFDVDNGASGRTATFWTSNDGITWTQLGSAVTTATATSIFSGPSVLEFGTNTTGTNAFYIGSIQRVQVWSGLRNLNAASGATLAFDADFTTKAWGRDSFTETSANAATVTLAGSVTLSADGALRIRAVTPGSAATISKTSGTISVTGLSLKDSTASGGATFNAVDSYSVSNNTGWNFISSSNGNFLLMF